MQGRVASSTSDRTSSRDIETIVEEFSGEPAQTQEISTEAASDASASLTPRAKSSLAKKLAKSLGFHGHKDSKSEAPTVEKAGPEQHSPQIESGAKQSDRGVHFTSQTAQERPASASSAAAAGTRTSSSSSAADKQILLGTNGNVKYVSPFQTAQQQPSGALSEAGAFYSPTSSFNSVASSRVPKALSASLDDDASQLRRSRMAPGNNPQSQSGDLEQMKRKPSVLEQASEEDRTVSGILSAKSRRSSTTYSVRSVDGKQF